MRTWVRDVRTGTRHLVCLWLAWSDWKGVKYVSKHPGFIAVDVVVAVDACSSAVFVCFSTQMRTNENTFLLICLPNHLRRIIINSTQFPISLHYIRIAPSVKTIYWRFFSVLIVSSRANTHEKHWQSSWALSAFTSLSNGFLRFHLNTDRSLRRWETVAKM